VDRAVIDGIELEYEDIGVGEPVVFIHGALIADAFRPLLSEAALANRYRLVSYHRRGYVGSSDATGEPAGIADHADDCRRLMSHLGVRRAHVVGHSLGAAIGLQLALIAPELVCTLSLLEAGLIIGESAPAYRQDLVGSMERYAEAGGNVAVHEFLVRRWPAYQEELERALPGAFEQAVTNARTCYEADLPALLDWGFGEAEARRITQPALVVLGDTSVRLDPRFPETYRLLLDWLPDAEGVILPEVTHFLQMQHPGPTADALARFLARHPLG
jgi:pimeloyl-ACP methyl ester carboxylesterase